MNIFVQIINIYLQSEHADRFSYPEIEQGLPCADTDYGDQPFYDALGRLTAEQLQENQP